MTKCFTFNKTRLHKKIICTLVIACALFLCFHLQYVVSTAAFFFMMRDVAPWPVSVDSTAVYTYPIDRLKSVAIFLTNKPERIQRSVIGVYQGYAHVLASLPVDTDFYLQYSKLYLLLRVLFDVPEEYPKYDTKRFDTWLGYPEPIEDKDIADLLWPLGYREEKLVLKALLVGTWPTISDPYNAIAEYDYFVTRFPLRYSKVSE